MLRSIFVAPEGKSFYCADFASIEARLVLWVAGEEKAMEVFRQGKDIYMELAKEINPQNPDRQLGKQGILLTGYGGGPNMFRETCQSYGMDISQTEAELAVGTYRATYPGVKKTWYLYENAFKSCLHTGDPQKVGNVSFTKETIASRIAICMYLPSGRKIIYWEPRMGQGNYGPTIEVVLRLQGGVMGRRRTWGGDIFQDAIQGMARDLMCYGARQASKIGFDIVATVHDEALALAEEDKDLDDFITAFSKTPDWAEGCPVSSSGWKGKYYRKD